MDKIDKVILIVLSIILIVLSCIPLKFGLDSLKDNLWKTSCYAEVAEKVCNDNGMIFDGELNPTSNHLERYNYFVCEDSIKSKKFFFEDGVCVR